MTSGPGGGRITGRSAPARSGVWAGVLAGMLAVTSCGLLDSPAPADTVAARVGDATVSYPKTWTVLGAADRSKTWDWVAQNVPGDDATAQLAVDGDHSALDVGFTVASLLAGAQVGNYPNFSLQSQVPVTIDGADSAERVDFTYRVGKVDYAAVWLVARGDGPRTVLVQLSGRKPLAAELVHDTVTGMQVR